MATRQELRRGMPAPTKRKRIETQISKGPEDEAGTVIVPPSRRHISNDEGPLIKVLETEITIVRKKHNILRLVNEPRSLTLYGMPLHSNLAISWHELAEGAKMLANSFSIVDAVPPNPNLTKVSFDIGGIARDIGDIVANVVGTWYSKCTDENPDPPPLDGYNLCIDSIPAAQSKDVTFLDLTSFQQFATLSLAMSAMQNGVRKCKAEEEDKS